MLNVTSLDIPASPPLVEEADSDSTEDEEEDEGVEKADLIRRCRDGDVLEIRDGYWHRSPLLARLCGSSAPEFPVVSSGSRMTITYRTTAPRIVGEEGETPKGEITSLGFTAVYEGTYVHKQIN